MSPFTFIFIGRSGCGKGTQVELLKKYLEEKYPGPEIFYLETGDRFRSFIKGEGYSNKLAYEIYQAGSRQPDFLAVWMWSHILVDSFKGTEHFIADGMPRSYPEALALATALKFYSRRAYVVYLNVSRHWSEERLLARGRFDDQSEAEVKKRLDWFETDVMSAVQYFRMDPQYTFLDIKGEQSIEQVNTELMQQLGI